MRKQSESKGNSGQRRESLYDVPELYRLAFAYRNIALEVSALIRWFKKLTPERKRPVTMLELAAGPADHAIEFARRGINATALDLSPIMCKFARRQARMQAVSLKVVKGDMIRFALEQRYDMVITMLDSVNQIHRINDMIKHLRSVAGCLSDDGLYVIELAKHEKKGEPLTNEKWRIRRNNKDVSVLWCPRAARSNGKSYKMSLAVIAKHGSRVSQVTDVMHLRTWAPKEIELAVSRSGCFRIAARYGDFREDMRASDKRAWSHILVLQKSATKVKRQRRS